MTDIGYDNIIKRLEGILVMAPDNYTACAKATREVLDEMKRGLGD